MAKPTVGTLAQLLVEDQVGRVTNAFTEIIGASMVADGCTPTAAEIKRRFDICLKVFCEVRADLKWAVERILDSLPVWLRCELDGGRYSPSNEAPRASWVQRVDPTGRTVSGDGPALVDPRGRPLALK